MRITLERRKNTAGDRVFLRLVYWYGSYTVIEGGKSKLKHRRERETLDLFLYADPANRLEKQHNKETLQLAEAIRAKRVMEHTTGEHGLRNKNKVDANFYALYRELMESKRSGRSNKNYVIWECALLRIKDYHSDESLSLKQITPDWIDGFKTFLQTQAKTKSGNIISNSTQYAYFNKLRETIKAAYGRGLMSQNPLLQVKGIKLIKTKRVYLDIEEVRALVAGINKHATFHTARHTFAVSLLQTAWIFTRYRSYWAIAK